MTLREGTKKAIFQRLKKRLKHLFLLPWECKLIVRQPRPGTRPSHVRALHCERTYTLQCSLLNFSHLILKILRRVGNMWIIIPISYLFLSFLNCQRVQALARERETEYSIMGHQSFLHFLLRSGARVHIHQVCFSSFWEPDSNCGCPWGIQLP